MMKCFVLLAATRSGYLRGDTIPSSSFMRHLNLNLSSVSLLQHAADLRFGVGNSTKNTAAAFELYTYVYHTNTSNDATSSAAAAAYSLGEMIFYGEEPDETPDQLFPSTALTFVNASASSGYPAAQHLLGIWYSTTDTHSSPQNDANAVLHHVFAARGGSASASLTLGYRHMKGDGVIQNCPTAMRHYKFAANLVLQQAEPLMIALKPRSYQLLQSYRQEKVSSIFGFTLLEQLESIQILGPFQAAQQASVLAAGRILAQSKQHNRQLLLRVADILTLVAGYSADSHDSASIAALPYLGHMYCYGLGVTRNQSLALQYYTEALQYTTLSTAEAEIGLGVMHLKGWGGLAVNHSAAFALFSHASLSGHPEALYQHGLLLLSNGNPRDAMQQFEWASSMGHIGATFQLGHASEFGRQGHPVSCSQALQLYKEVGEASQEITFTLGRALEAYHAGQVLVAARLWQKLAAEGLVLAQSNLLVLHKSHPSILSDSEVFLLLEAATKQGLLVARVMLGDVYYQRHQYDQAASHYQRASRFDAQAMYNLGFMYEHGLGKPKSLLQASSCYATVLHMDSEATFMALMIVKVRVKTKCDAFLWCRTMSQRWGQVSDRLTQYWSGEVEGVVVVNPPLSSSSEAATKPFATEQVRPLDASSIVFSTKASTRIESLTKMTTQTESSKQTVHGLSFHHKAHLQVKDINLHLKNTLTLEGWFKVEAPFQGDSMVLVQQLDVLGFLLIEFNGGFKVWGQYYPDAKGVVSKTVLDCGSWVHLALVKHESFIALYINGRMDSVRKYPGALNKSSSSRTPTMTIGSHATQSQFYNGKMTQLRLWSSFKTPDEVKQLMHQDTRALTESLELVWTLPTNGFKSVNRPDETKTPQTDTGNRVPEVVVVDFPPRV